VSTRSDASDDRCAPEMILSMPTDWVQEVDLPALSLSTYADRTSPTSRAAELSVLTMSTQPVSTMTSFEVDILPQVGCMNYLPQAQPRPCNADTEHDGSVSIGEFRSGDAWHLCRNRRRGGQQIGVRGGMDVARSGRVRGRTYVQVVTGAEVPMATTVTSGNTTTSVRSDATQPTSTGAVAEQHTSVTVTNGGRRGRPLGASSGGVAARSQTLPALNARSATSDDSLLSPVTLECTSTTTSALQGAERSFANRFAILGEMDDLPDMPTSDDHDSLDFPALDTSTTGSMPHLRRVARRARKQPGVPPNTRGSGRRRGTTRRSKASRSQTIPTSLLSTPSDQAELPAPGMGARIPPGGASLPGKDNGGDDGQSKAGASV
jgi:hypothetical protein